MVVYYVVRESLYIHFPSCHCLQYASTDTQEPVASKFNRMMTILSMMQNRLTSHGRIRRIKCDETKPHCSRCTSTGRACDGYLIPERKKPTFTKKPTQSLTTQGPVTPTRVTISSRAANLLRPLGANIDGTEQERQFFHWFQRTAEEDSVLRVSKLSSDFWSRLLPQVGHQNGAVKHALVALGAAYQRKKIQSQGTPASSVDSPFVEELESFMIRQYNKAIHHLQQHISSTSLENIEIILLCCLIFVCLETARGNREQSQIHVTRGIRIIEALIPADLLLYSASSESNPNIVRLDRAARVCGYNPSRVSQREWHYLVERFCDFEFASMIVDDGGTRPSISHRFCEMGIVDERGLQGFRSADEVHNAYIHWYLRAFDRASYTASHKGDAVWWADPEQKRLHDELLSWLHRLELRFEEFMKSPYAPTPEQWAAYFSVSCNSAYITLNYKFIPKNKTWMTLRGRLTFTL